MVSNEEELRTEHAAVSDRASDIGQPTRKHRHVYRYISRTSRPHPHATQCTSTYGVGYCLVQQQRGLCRSLFLPRVWTYQTKSNAVRSKYTPGRIQKEKWHMMYARERYPINRLTWGLGVRASNLQPEATWADTHITPPFFKPAAVFLSGWPQDLPQMLAPT